MPSLAEIQSVVGDALGPSGATTTPVDISASNAPLPKGGTPRLVIPDGGGSGGRASMTVTADAPPNEQEAASDKAAPSGQSPSGGQSDLDQKLAIMSKAEPVELPEDKPVELKPGQKTGMAANVAAGVQEGAAGVVNAAADPFGNLVGKPLVIGLTALYDWAAPKLGFKPLEEDERNALLGRRDPEQIGTKAVNALNEAGGAPRLEDVVPGGAGEGLARSTVGGAVMGGLMGPGAIAGGAGGFLGDVFSQIAPDKYKDFFGLLGNFMGAGGTAAAGKSLKAPIGFVDNRVLAPMGLTGKSFTVMGEDGNPIIGTDGKPIKMTDKQAQIMGKKLAGMMRQEPAEAKSAIDTARSAPENQGIVGQPSIGQLTGNLSQLNEERVLQNQDRAPFESQRASNNMRRVSAIVGMAGPEEAHTAAKDFSLRMLREAEIVPFSEEQMRGQANAAASGLPNVSPNETGEAIRQQVAENHAPAVGQSEEALGAARSALEGAQGNTLPPVTPNDVQTQSGRVQQGLEALRQGRKDFVSWLFNRIDPNGRLVVDMRPVIQAAKAELDVLEKRENLTRPEASVAALLERAANQKPADYFQQLKDLRSSITTELRKQRTAQNDLDAGRLTGLLRGIDSVLSDEAGRVGAKDAAGVSNGTMRPDETIGAQMMDQAPDNAPPAPMTAPTTIYTASGRPIDVRYKVMPIDKVIASHDPDFRINPAYPAELQPRDRKTMPSQAQVHRIAGNLQPERLGVGSTPNDGAPVVGSDGVVESGNARTMALARVLQENGPAADAYRAMLKRMGYENAGPNDILVRERTSELTPEERKATTREANVDQGLRQTPAEVAAIDASRIGDGVLSLWRGGEVDHDANAPFVRGFMRDVVPPNEQGGMVDSEGRLLQPGKDRITQALIEYGYGDNLLTSRLSGNLSDNLKAYGEGLRDAATDYARLRSDIHAGRVDPGLDIASHLADAARVIDRARKSGMTIRDTLAQQGLLGQIDPLVRQILETAYGPGLKGRANEAQVARWIKAYAADAREQIIGQNSLFGEQSRTASEILKAVGDKYGRSGEAAEDVTARSAGGNAGVREGGAPNGEPGNGPAGPAANEGTGGGGGGNRGGSAEPAGSAGGPPQRPTQRVIEPELRPNVTDRTRQEYAEARGEHADYSKEMREGPVGDVLKPGARKGELVMEASRAAPRLFNSGGTPAEDIQSFVRAVGGRTNEEALAAFGPRAVDPETGQVDPARLSAMMKARQEAIDGLQRYAGISLRDAAMKDGLIDAKAARGWLEDHRAALDAFPELRDKFKNLADLRQQFDDLKAERAAIDKQHPLADASTNAALTARYVRMGPKGAEAVQSYIRDTGGSPEAMATLEDAFASKLRERAMRGADWSQDNYETWMRQHASALSEMPDLAKKLGTLGDAQKFLVESAGRRQADIQALQDSALRHYIGNGQKDLDVSRAVRSLMSSDSALADTRELLGRFAHDPEAMAGFRRNLMEWAFDKVRSQLEAGTTGQREVLFKSFANIMRSDRYGAVLREALAPEQLKVMEGVLRGLELETRAHNATGIRGGPGTAADLHALEQNAPIRTVLEQLFMGEAASQVLHHVTGNKSLAMKVAGQVLAGAWKYARAAGFKSIRDLAIQVSLNPEAGSIVLQHAITDPKSPMMEVMGRRILQLGAMGADADQRKYRQRAR